MIRRVKNILVIIGCWVMFSGVYGQITYRQAGDSTMPSIVFDCTITFDGSPIGREDFITVHGMSYDSLFVDGQSTLESDSNYVIYLQGDTTFNLIENYQNLVFKFESVQRGCLSYNIELNINTSLSQENLLVIDRFDIFSHYFMYPESTFCKGQGIVLPVTDIPVNYIELFSANGLIFSPQKGIDTDKSLPGEYTISMETEYCLEEGVDTIHVNLIPKGNASYPDTLHICQEGASDQITTLGYDIYSIGDTDLLNPQQNISESGNYLIRNRNGGPCEAIDTVYIDVVEPVSLFVNQEKYCDYVRVEVVSESFMALEYSWSTGSTLSAIELSESTELSLTITDQYGCESIETFNIDYAPFAIESLDFEKIESDCWQDGKLLINSIQMADNASELNYVLVNKINGNRVENLEEVPEGIYQIEVSDQRNCIDNYPEEITVLQNCLNDYPVFSPDQDGIEDEYFIPHEGTVKIFDRNGVMLKELNTPAYWDGTDDAGNQMPMGNYVMMTESGRVVNITIIR